MHMLCAELKPRHPWARVVLLRMSGANVVDAQKSVKASTDAL